MAEEKISIDVLINTAESTKSLTELRSVTKQLQDQLKQTGLGASDVAKIESALSGTREKVEDINAALNAGKDGGLQGLSSLGRNIAGTFGVATGALGLFGSKNEELNAIINKVNASVALLSGIQSAADAIRDAGILKGLVLSKAKVTALAQETVATEGAAAATGVFATIQGGLTAATTLATTALRTLWTTLLANPLTAILAGITAIAAATYAWVLATDDTTEANERLKASLDRLNNNYDANYQAEVDLQNLRRKAANDFIAQKKAEGASVKEIYDLETAEINKQLVENAKLQGLVKNNSKEEQALKVEEQGLRAKFALITTQFKKDEQKLNKETHDKYVTDKQKELELERERIKLQGESFKALREYFVGWEAFLHRINETDKLRLQSIDFTESLLQQSKAFEEFTKERTRLNNEYLAAFEKNKQAETTATKLELEKSISTLEKFDIDFSKKLQTISLTRTQTLKDSIDKDETVIKEAQNTEVNDLATTEALKLDLIEKSYNQRLKIIQEVYKKESLETINFRNGRSDAQLVLDQAKEEQKLEKLKTKAIETSKRAAQVKELEATTNFNKLIVKEYEQPEILNNLKQQLDERLNLLTDAFKKEFIAIGVSRLNGVYTEEEYNAKVLELDKKLLVAKQNRTNSFFIDANKELRKFREEELGFDRSSLEKALLNQQQINQKRLDDIEVYAKERQKIILENPNLTQDEKIKQSGELVKEIEALKTEAVLLNSQERTKIIADEVNAQVQLYAQVGNSIVNAAQQVSSAIIEIQNNRAALETQQREQAYTALSQKLQDEAALETQALYDKYNAEIEAKKLTNDYLNASDEERARLLKEIEDEQTVAFAAAQRRQVEAKFKADYDKAVADNKAITDQNARAKKAFEIQKALQIAQVTMNTVVAASAAFATLAATAAGLAAAPFVATGIGIAGAAQVAVIAATKFVPGNTGALPTLTPYDPSSSSSGGSSGSSGSSNSQFVGGFDFNNNALFTGNQYPFPMSDQRVYVLESDITTTQGRVATIEDRNTF